MDRAKVLDRVRKLYAMSQAADSSPNEAEIALRRCQSLMAKFGVTISDLETSEYGSSTIGRTFRAIPSYITLLASAVSVLHDCVCVESDEIEFRGFSIDAEVASLTFDYLSNSLERSLRQRKEEGSLEPGRKASFDYRVGYASAVLRRCRQIHEERQQEEMAAVQAQADSGEPGVSLIIRKRELVREHCLNDVTIGRAKTIRYRGGAAHSAGSSDGEQVSLDKQLGV